ncbi:hypothetical protein ACWGE0_00545 [Lentzea sp. NPDC054927]
MNFTEDSTWVISSGDGGTFPLFVRDALGISTPTADSIPRLAPPVPRLTGVEVPGLAQGWDRWWLECATGSSHEPVGVPDHLRAAYTRWSDPRSLQSTYIRDEVRRTFSASLHEVVTELQEELGRRLVFSLDVLQIPVEGQFWRRLQRDRVLVSEELLLSRNVIAPLESVIRELAQ